MASSRITNGGSSIDDEELRANLRRMTLGLLNQQTIRQLSAAGNAARNRRMEFQERSARARMAKQQANEAAEGGMNANPSGQTKDQGNYANNADDDKATGAGDEENMFGQDVGESAQESDQAYGKNKY